MKKNNIPDGKYEAPIKCDNCGYYEEMLIDKGTEIKNIICPNCETKNLTLSILHNCKLKMTD